MIEKKQNYFLKYLLNISSTQVVALGFLLLILIGSILLNLPAASRNGESIGYIDALFTATSAVCVTGLIVADTYTQWTTFGQIVIISLIQFGGLGFMTMATMFSLILRRKITYRERLIMAESLNQYSLEGIVRLTKQILLGTLLFEGIGAALLSIHFISEFGIANGIFKGIFHSISAFCNAGFDLMGEKGEYVGLTGYVGDIIVNVTIMSLIIIGGLGFSVWNNIYRCRKFKNLTLHTRLVLLVTAILLATGFVSFLLLEYNNPDTLQPLDLQGKILGAAFQSVTVRTAGYNTISQSGLTNASKFLTIILMFIGGSPGSTAGGIKTATAGVLILSVIAVIRGMEEPELFKRRLHYSIVLRALTIVGISLAIILAATIILSICENALFIEVLFEVTSAFGTVGLSLGITSTLSDISKIVLVATMYFGRVGVLTMALALTRRRHMYNRRFKYPEGKIMVG